jgi:hypothetical protein
MHSGTSPSRNGPQQNGTDRNRTERNGTHTNDCRRTLASAACRSCETRFRAKANEDFFAFLNLELTSGSQETKTDQANR